VEALTAIYGLRSDLVLLLRNMRSDYVHLREQIRCINETLGRMSQQSQATPYMFYGQPSQFNAPPSNVSFNSVNPGVSFSAAPSSIDVNVGTPVTVTAHSSTCIFFILL
jgi:hypothetical protein